MNKPQNNSSLSSLSSLSDLECPEYSSIEELISLRKAAKEVFLKYADEFHRRENKRKPLHLNRPYDLVEVAVDIVNEGEEKEWKSVWKYVSIDNEVPNSEFADDFWIALAVSDQIDQLELEAFRAEHKEIIENFWKNSERNQ